MSAAKDRRKGFNEVEAFLEKNPAATAVFFFRAKIDETQSGGVKVDASATVPGAVVGRIGGGFSRVWEDVQVGEVAAFVCRPSQDAVAIAKMMAQNGADPRDILRLLMPGVYDDGSDEDMATVMETYVRERMAAHEEFEEITEKTNLDAGAE